MGRHKKEQVCDFLFLGLMQEGTLNGGMVRKISYYF